jgi:RNA recognition motif-containing protein
LIKEFKKYGHEVVDCHVPIKDREARNPINRGFGFMEFKTKEFAREICEKANDSSFKGRKIVVELSVPKGQYEKKVDHIVANTKLSKEDAVLPK